MKNSNLQREDDQARSNNDVKRSHHEELPSCVRNTQHCVRNSQQRCWLPLVATAPDQLDADTTDGPWKGHSASLLNEGWKTGFRDDTMQLNRFHRTVIKINQTWQLWYDSVINISRGKILDRCDVLCKLCSKCVPVCVSMCISVYGQGEGCLCVCVYICVCSF